MFMVAGTGISVAGIIMLIAGISILIFAGSQLFLQLEKDGILLNNVELAAGDSISAKIGVAMSNPNHNTQLNGIIIASQPTEVPVIAEIRGSSGETVSQFKVDRNPFTTSYQGQSDREYTLLIRNTGEKAVTLQAAVVNIPSYPTNISSVANLAVWESNTLLMAIGVGVGAILSIAGVVAVLIGTIKTSRAKSTEEKKHDKHDVTKYPYTKS